MVGICLILMLLVSVSAAEPLMQREGNASQLFGPDPDELNYPDIPIRTPESVLESFARLQQQISADGLDVNAVIGPGWQEVSRRSSAPVRIAGQVATGKGTNQGQPGQGQDQIAGFEDGEGA